MVNNGTIKMDSLTEIEREIGAVRHVNLESIPRV